MRGFLLLAALLPALASAHSFGRQYALPVPLWLYVYGSAAALALSFLLAAFFMRQRLPERTRAPQRLYGRGHWRKSLRALALGLLLLTIVSGFLGNRDPYANFSMTFFWIAFLLGYAYVCSVFGDSYRDINPWQTLALIVFKPPWRRGWLRYPRWLNYWPALLGYMALIWIELFWHNTPMALAQLLLAYSAYTLLAMWLFGIARWAQYGELFSVLFRLMAKLSPWHLSRHAAYLQAPLAGLLRTPPRHLAMLLFIVFLLSATAFDGLRASRWWVTWFWQDRSGVLTAWMGSAPIYHVTTLRPVYLLFESLVLLLSPLIYAALYWLSMAAAKVLTGTSLSRRQLCLYFAYSLLPIALVYNITHYYTLLFTQGVKLVSLFSDPFGWGWNLVGTAGLWRAPILPDVALVWHTQVALIVAGHVASVYCGHRLALQLFANRRQAMLSQLPLVLLMMAFTASGLWILAQPIGAR